MYAAKVMGGDCTVLAFEPEALTCAKLNRNISINGLTGKMTAYCLAIADRLQIGPFYVASFAPAAALHAFGKPETQGERAFAPKHIEGGVAISLDELIALGAPFPTHMKIDVDGLETAIMDGAEATLADERLRSVLIEVYMYKDTAEYISRAFTEAGMELTNPEAITYQAGKAEHGLRAGLTVRVVREWGTSGAQ